MHEPRRRYRASTSWLFAALALMIGLAACGDDATVVAADDHSGDHEHALFEVPDGQPIPTIDIEVEPDPVSGVNVYVDVTDFIVAPERASTDPVAGEGHFHVYVNGEKIARFYNQSVHLPIDEGEQTVMVELSANNHAPYAVDGMPITAQTTVSVPEPAGGHHHSDPVEAAAPTPIIDLTVTPDPKSGWNVHAAVENLTFAPRSAGLDAVEGEGHLHLYVDGEKITRLYGEWWHLDPLPAGEHEITVEATANNHAPYVSNGEPVTASVTIDVDEAQAAEETGGHDGEHGEHGEGDDHDSAHDMAASGGAAVLDIEAEEADTLIEIVVAGGKVERDETRFVVDEGSTVGVVVASDTFDHVHVHGYEILTTTGPDSPAEFAFTADSSGVFEVELEDRGLFLFDLQVG